jgi:hypothetical protein
MATADTYPHVILNADGKASIEGTRYTVEHIAAEQYLLRMVSRRDSATASGPAASRGLRGTCLLP